MKAMNGPFDLIDLQKIAAKKIPQRSMTCGGWYELLWCVFDTLT
jgi:hypothetical protein